MKIYGAKWWKFDFHTHSGASKDYGKGDKKLEEITPRDWLLEFMKKEIDCVAVTDHNNGLWIDILKSELEIMERENCKGYRKLYLFPGIELNTNGNIHLLGIFPIDYNSAKISEVVGATEYNENEECTTKSFSDVVNIIINKGGIPIPAHVDKNRGLFQIEGATLKNCLNSKFIAMEVIDRSFTKPELYLKNKINLTEVLGSDCHTLEQVGKQFTWVKMEEPSIEALWLALHDGRDGVLRNDEIRTDPNDLSKRFYIQKLEINNGFIIGRGSPFIIYFNPWMNTLIGGRGSGKSSILNFLRLPFNLDKDITPSLIDNLSNFFQISKGRTTPGMLLATTKVSVELWKDGRLVKLEWLNNNINEQHFDVESNQWIDKGKNNSIKERFPIRLYHQKEIYEITEDPSAILKLIDNQYNSMKIKEQLKKNESLWLESKNYERKYQMLIEEHKNVIIKLDDIEAKIKFLEKNDNDKIMRKYKKANKIEGEIKKLVSSFNNINEGLLKLKSIEKLELNANFEIDDESILILNELIRKTNTLIDDTLEKVKKIDDLNYEWCNLESKLPWFKEKGKIVDEYNDIISQLNLSGDSNILEKYQSLINEKEDLLKQKIAYEKIKSELIVQQQTSKKLYQLILNLNKQIRKQREEVIKEWNKRNNSLIISLNHMGELKSETEFRQLIRKGIDDYKKDILEYNEDGEPIHGVLYDIASATNEKAWEIREQVFDDILGNTNFSRYFLKHLNNIKEKTPEDLDRLKIWFPEDKIIIKLKDENGRMSEIDTGSAGEKNSALLSLILSLEDLPIIIDQPEDDLDTKRISSLVVNGFRKLKLNQQVIVVTHNPNIPVNGGAEQIIHLGIKNGNIHPLTSGALQKWDVRYSVCEVMEGGKEALDNRYHRISNALDTKLTKKP